MKMLAPLIALLAAVGLADWANWLEGVAAMIPDWLETASVVIAAAASVAAVTPTKKDDSWVAKARTILDALAVNFGNAKNKDDDEPVRRS